VTYLYDAAGNGDYVVMWPTEPGSTLFTVQGRYRPAAAATYIDANLVFDQSTGRLVRVWGQQPGGGQSPAEILPQANDEFQLTTLYLDEAGQVTGESGPQLFFDEAAQLHFEWRPLPAGDYFLGFLAENVAGETAEAFTDLPVDNSDLVPGYEAYFDPYLGFQFLYPESWYRPVYSDTLLYTTNLPATTQMQVTLYPNLETGVDVAALKTQTLNLFGPVDVLFEDEVTVGDRLGLRTAYGYTGDGGQTRTGLFFTFVKGSVGFVIDVNDPKASGAATIDAVATIAQSWQFAQAGFGLRPGEWATVDLEAFSVAQPADFAYQPYNEWQRFVADRHTFVALRSQPVTRPVADVLAALVRDAGAGVTDFNADEPYPLPLGRAVWQRVDFSYAAADGTEIWGFIMVKVEGDQEVVAWAEAPATVYNGLEGDVFLVMIADLALAE
jgi:hypothetical protein